MGCGIRPHHRAGVAGSVEHGTITFKGHLPEGLTDATLTLKSGDAAITVPGLALSN